MVLHVLHNNKLSCLIFEPPFRYLQQLASSARGVLQRLLCALRSRWTRVSKALTGSVHAACAFALRSHRLVSAALHNVLQRVIGALRSSWTRVSEALIGPLRAAGAFALGLHQLVSAALHKGLHHLVPRSSREARDPEAQLVDQGLDGLAEKECTLDLEFPVISISKLEAPSIKWLLETSTDPEVFLAAAKFAPQVEWPLDLDVLDMLPQLYSNFTSCVDVQEQIVPSLEEKASACTMALSHLYSGCVLRAYPDCGETILGQKETDYELFKKMTNMYGDNRMVFATATTLCVQWFDILKLSTEDFPVIERLSHILPYNFFTRRVNETETEKISPSQ